MLALSLDGSIAFWAVDDEDRPLLVRTLEDIDVNIIDGEKLSEVLGGEEGDSTSLKPAVEPPEPIFKLSWSGFPYSSDPRGGFTTLTVLGGGRGSSDAQGVTTLLLPAFNPVDSADTKSSSNLSPSMRDAMRESVIHSNSYTYATTGIVHDYCLLPRNSPHFSGSFDPAAIIILSEIGTGARSTDAHEFPPPVFEIKPIVNDPKPSPSDPDSVSDDLASTLESMKLADDPHRLDLPTPLWNGNSSITDGDILRLDADQYKSLLGPGTEIAESSYGLSGGVTWTDDTEGESRHAKVSLFA